ncbi:MAG: NERD domain-containing protein, partial [Nocardioidaceae bacterium]
VVRALLGDEVPIRGVLCFVEADWPLIGGSFTTRGVEALRPKRLYARLSTEGSLDSNGIAALHRRLGSALPSA